MTIQQEVADGVVDGAKRILADKEMMHDFCAAIFASAGDSSRQWVGSKILAWIGYAALAGGLYLVARFGLPELK